MVKRNGTQYFILAISFLLIVSCNYTKLVPKGDALYTGATIKVEDSTLSKKEKKKVVALTSPLPRPKPNSRILGIPFKLIIYNLAGDTSKKGFIRKFLRKFGEPPVLLSRVNLAYNEKVIKNFMENVGYFRVDDSGDTTIKNKKAHATYTVEPGPVYTIDTVNFVTDSTALGKSILQEKKGTLLHTGDPFNLEVVKGERARLDAILKQEGYYYFNPDLLIITADSTIATHKTNMYLMVKENTPEEAKKPYIIDDVFIYPNYRLNTARTDTANKETDLYEGYYITDPHKKFNKSLFPRIMVFDSGDVYNRNDHNLSLNRLINLDVFKFVKNRFELSPNSEGDTGRLNTYYYLTPLPSKSLRAELAGNTKSNNYVGSLITLTWKNRNLLKGAEHLDAHLNLGTEVQYGGTQSGFNTYSFGGGLTFTTPRFVVPFFSFNTSSAYVPKTKIDLSYDLLNRRKLYTLNSFKGELGYVWKPSLKIQNELNLVSINLVQALNVTQLYLDSLAVIPVLQHAIDTQFIIGTNYAITYDPLINNPKGTGWYFNGLIDFSGNIAGLATGANVKNGNQKTLLGVPFSQYMKAQADVRYYYAINNNLRLANRVIIGAGIPNGNSLQLPFIKQFFIGGNNSLRAFRSRSVGPGTYRDTAADAPSNGSFFPDESGDIKLEMNTELRPKINKIIEGALFLDAGNIWLYNKDTGPKPRAGVQFTKDFLTQLAVGGGVGLRFDLTILLLRLDLAIPLREPWLEPGNRWVIDQINFGSSEWRKKNLIFNLAIGYPF